MVQRLLVVFPRFFAFEAAVKASALPQVYGEKGSSQVDIVDVLQGGPVRNPGSRGRVRRATPIARGLRGRTRERERHLYLFEPSGEMRASRKVA